LETEPFSALDGKFRSVWVFAEHANGAIASPTAEAVSLARRLANDAGSDWRVVALSLGPGGEKATGALGRAGAHVVRVCEDERFRNYCH
jgi:electron transfer flavoprotein alpha subunit